MEYVHISHPFAPVWNSESRILILGSLPSAVSRRENFYYANPRNRFWSMISAVLGEREPASVDEKMDLLQRHGIALWDVVQSCDIHASSDSSIRNVEATDLKAIIAGSKIKRVLCNGKKAGELYAKYQGRELGIPAVVLPSTSPANAACSFEELTERWSRELVTQKAGR